MKRPRKILLGAGLALALAGILALLLFDWNWFRGSLERYVAKKSGREVKIGHLDVALGPNPTIRLRDLHVQNAPWAAGSQPLIVAAEAAFTISLRSLWEDLNVVSLIELTDAEVDLQRQADGLRNWRLIDPEYRGPPRTRVLALQAQRSRLRVVNRAFDLELAAAASEAPPSGNPALKSRIDFSGLYQGSRFAGTAATGPRLTLRGSGESFPLLGHMQWSAAKAEPTRLEVDGSVGDLLELASVDAKIRAAGPSLADLHPFLRLRPPATRPYRLEGQIKRAEGETTLANLQGKVGQTDLAGEIAFSRREPRPLVRADLRSNSGDFADFLTAAGARATDAGRIFPEAKLDASRLSTNDARVSFQAKKMKAGGALVLTNLRLTAALEGGQLQLSPVEFGLAGGSVSGSLSVDAREGDPSAQLAADFRKLSLAALFPEAAAKSRAAGAVDARLKLSGRGESLAALAGSATGSFDASMDGGRISNLADAKLALSLGKVLALKLRGDQDIAILCAALGVDFRNGAGRSRAIVLDTEQTRTEGAGSINLRNETFDVLLKPRSKNPGLLSIGAAVRVEGSFRNPRFSVARDGDRAAPVSGGACGRPVAVAR